MNIIQRIKFLEKQVEHCIHQNRLLGEEIKYLKEKIDNVDNNTINIDKNELTAGGTSPYYIENLINKEKFLKRAKKINGKNI